MAAKEQNNAELFDLWKKAAVMKQIKTASYAKDRKKTVGGEITNNWGKISSTKNVSCLDLPLF